MSYFGQELFRLVGGCKQSHVVVMLLLLVLYCSHLLVLAMPALVPLIADGSAKGPCDVSLLLSRHLCVAQDPALCRLCRRFTSS